MIKILLALIAGFIFGKLGTQKTWIWVKTLVSNLKTRFLTRKK